MWGGGGPEIPSKNSVSDMFGLCPGSQDGALRADVKDGASGGRG